MEIEQSLGLREDTLVDRVVLWLGVIAFTGTVVLAGLQVLNRYIPAGTSLYWTEPMARYLLIVGTYLGAAVATRNHEHISMYLVQNMLRDNALSASALRLFNSFAILLFMAIVVVATTNSALGNWSTQAGGSGIVSLGMLYLGISIGCLLVVVFEVIEFRSLAREAVVLWRE